MRKHIYIPIGALIFVLLATASAEAQGVTCPSDYNFNENHWSVDECLGNCGAGCSNSVNPCSNGQGWVVDQFYGPAEEMWYAGEIEGCDGEYRCTSQCSAVRIPGHFTYHGYFSMGCYDHDVWCRTDDPRCYAPPPNFLANICNGEHPAIWPYEGYVTAVQITDTQCVYAWPECPEIYWDEPSSQQLLLEMRDVARRLMNGEVLTDKEVDTAGRALLATTRAKSGEPMQPEEGVRR